MANLDTTLEQNLDTTLEQNESRAERLLERAWGLSIGGTSRPARSGATFGVVSPYSRQQIASVPNGGVEDVELAVSAAVEAFGSWRQTTVAQRVKYLEDLCAAIQERAADFAVLDAVDAGIPIAYMAQELRIVASLFKYFCGLAMEVKGTTIPASSNIHFTERIPFGVVATIVPFNHPFEDAARKIVAPLITGNTVVLKPSELTPLSALLLGEVINDVLPPGVVNVVVGDGPTVPQALVAHSAVRRVGFTGSEPTGRAIVRAAAEKVITGVSLELGGKNALIAFPDAEPQVVADAAIRNMNFTWSGQSCSSMSRLLVHEDIEEATVDAIVQSLQEHRVGNPLDPETSQGTIVSERQFDRILGFIERGVRDGARVAAGGSRPEGIDEGWFVAPTVLVDVDPYSEVAQEEIFGPVLSVIRFRDEDEALKISNSVKYGLTGAVFTNDIKRAHRVARQIESGMVGINGSAVAGIGLPGGGVKGSGLGRELSLEELHSYTQIKVTTVYVD
jgi:acyl-CoA reductase-like NAD-dependent aldehyde dehydrogenase